jgi:hypothetical protein
MEGGVAMDHRGGAPLWAPLLCCLGIQAGWAVMLIGLERLVQPQPAPPALVVLSPVRT